MSSEVTIHNHNSNNSNINSNNRNTNNPVISECFCRKQWCMDAPFTNLRMEEWHMDVSFTDLRMEEWHMDVPFTDLRMESIVLLSSWSDSEGSCFFAGVCTCGMFTDVCAVHHGIVFCLVGESLYKSHPCDFPCGPCFACSNSILSNLSFACPKESNH